MSLLNLRGLDAGYGRRTVIEGLDLTIEEGTVTILIGPNGSGKSTLFRAMYGLARVFSCAEFAFLGRSLEVGSRDPWFRSQTSFVPQYASVFPSLALRDNLRLALGAEQSTVDDDASLVAQILGGPLRRRLGEKAGNLSGGQRQLLALSMGVRSASRLILLDEPLAGLDEAATKSVMAGICQLRDDGGKTIIIAEHRYLQLATIADRLIGLRQGKLALDIAGVRGLDRSTLERRTDDMFFG